MGLRSTIILGLSFLVFGLSAQRKDFQEEVHLSLNTTNILVGETLYFSAFVYSNASRQLSSLSSVLYVELIDEEGTAIHQTKIGLREGRGSGSIKINPEWVSSTYRIEAYTKWMRNYDSHFEQKLLVLNPYARLTNELEIAGNPVKAEKGTQELETYGTLQNITMNIGYIDPASLAITVHETPELFYSNDISLNNPQVEMDTYRMLPDYKYALVQGQIKGVSGLQGSSRRVNMTVRGESLQVATSKTDEYGRFWMNYNPDITTGDAAVQIQCEDESIELDVVSEFKDNYSPLTGNITILDSVFVNQLITRSIHSQIRKAYLESEFSQSTERNVYLDRKEAIVYYLDEYKRFTSIRDTFIELTIHVGASKSEESDNLFVRCEQPPGLTSSNRSPLILLDGLRVDARTLLEHNPNEIEKIEVLPAYYFVNDMAYKGVISAHTFDGAGNTTDKNDTFPLAEFQPYSGKDHSLTITENLPHYESSILWKPIHIHQGGQLELDFSTSRLEGNYQVSITGITNSGKPLNIVRYFQVSSTYQ